MILGIALILLGCVINSGAVLLPGVIAGVVSFFVNGFLHKLKIRNEHVEELVRTWNYLVSLLFAASLQVYLWNLLPGKEPLRWTVAQATFVLGTGTWLVIKIYGSGSPFERAWSARRFMMGTILLSTVLAVSYDNVAVFRFVERAPYRVFVFVFGAVDGGAPSNTSK